MRVNCYVLLIGLSLLERARSEDYSQRKPDAVIYIDTRSQPPLNLTKNVCRKFENSDKFGGEVCGNDDKTYSNMMYLKCYNRRQQAANRIQVKHHGPCQEGNLPSACVTQLIYKPVCGNDNRTYANIEALNCKNAMLPDYHVRVAKEGQCTTEACPCRGELDKVCASNGITYRNVGEVRCLKKWHQQLRVLHYGGCTIREVRRAMGRRIACHTSKNRFEWNPVCGQNNLTYANPYVYICHRPKFEGKCAAKPGECGTLKQLACLHMEKINKNEMESTSLICGSNGVTYRSYEHLHCSTNYDKYLTAVSTGRCSKKYDPCALVKTPLIDSGQPVCGTDDVTYTSIESLWCTKRKEKKDLRFKHDGQCI